MNNNAQSNGAGIRVFKSDFMESLTHVHPALPIIVWGPVTAYLFYDGLADQSLAAVALAFALGIVVWTFTEYILHRYVFHYPAKSKIGKRFVFMFHGLHHDEPQCKTRLVFPPVPAFLILCLFYGLFSLVVPAVALHTFLAGFLVGYLCYDYIHYATHHFPMTSKVGRYLRKYHLQHHYSCPDAKFGVSNPLWDYVFKTVNTKKKRQKNTESTMNPSVGK